MNALPKDLTNVAVCTCQRPESLRLLLESISRAHPPQTSVLVSIVDNDPNKSAEPVYRELADTYPFPMHYFWEPRRGIPIARNRALKESISLGVNNVVFVDDDEWVDENWLDQLYSYYRSKNGSCVISGKVIACFPDNTPEHFRSIFRSQSRPTGKQLTSSATNNVIFPLSLTTQLGLWFDESSPLSGGTDTLFFCSAVNKGVEIYHCADAVVHERIPPLRLTSKWLVKRKFRSGLATGQRKRKAGRSAFTLIGSSMFQCLLYASLALLYKLTNQKKSYLKAIKKASRNAGIIAGFMRVKVDSYQKIDH